MVADNALALLAEVGAAIAGFSSIVVVFGGRAEGKWTKPDRVRLWVLVGGSLAVVFFAMLPGAIRFLHGSEALAWGVSSGLLIAFLIAGAVFLFFQMRGQVAFGAEALDPRIALMNLFLNLLIIGLQIANLIGPFAREPGPFVVGLMLLLLSSAGQFIRLVFTKIQPSA